MNVGFENLGQRWRQIRFNPLRSLTPERLAAALDSSAAGWLRDAAMIYESIEQREAIVRSVMTKRRSAVARRDWQIIVPDPDHPNAEAHKATLEYFYSNLTCTDATDLNVRTGMSGLLRQMMDSVIQRYAAHEIVWQPTAEGLTAELRRVPLYFFENRSGKLRFVGPENRPDGMPLEDDGWMITVHDGLGEALAICYMYKRLGIQDWVAFSEKFSIPGVMGRTSAAKDSPEGIAMAASVVAYASEWVGLVYGDDGSVKDPISVIQTPSGATLPQKELVEYMDRMIATLVRGGDLSTISNKDGVGSNPQDDETDALLADDCQLVTETLNTQLDRAVIRMVHGDEKPAAYISIRPPDNEDLEMQLRIDQGLSTLGVKQDAEDLAERYGREIAEVPDPVALVTAPLAPAANETTKADPILAALSADLQPLGRALEAAMAAGDMAAMRAALKKISKDMPDFLESSALAEAMGEEMLAALSGEDEPAANEGNSEGARKGWETRRSNGWANRPKGTGKPKKAKEVPSISAVLDSAFEDPDNRDFTDYQELGVKEIAAIEARAGRAPVEVGSLKGMRRTLEAEKAMKILSKHAKDRYPVTEEDFHSLPSYLAAPTGQKWEVKKGQTPRLISTIHRGRDLLIVEEVQTGNGRLTVLSMYRP